MDRQSAWLQEVIPRARAAGVTHLLHVDDDELVYCAMGVGVLYAELAAAPPDRPDLHMSNVEALLPREDCANHFLEARAFQHCPTRYCSYTNGKSFARLDAAGLRSHGPHHFRSAAGAGGKVSPVTHAIPACVACVLHYESATFAKWRQKYVELARAHGDDAAVCSKVPFKFYRESLQAGLALLRAEESGDSAALRSAEDAATHLWRRCGASSAHP